MFSSLHAGYQTNLVYLFTRTRPRVYAIRGAPDQKARIVGTPSLQDIHYRGQVIKDGARYWPIGVHTLKKDLYGRLLIERPGPRYLHFPHGLEDEYYEQLTAEKLEKKYHKGYLVEEWKKLRPRNEALDKYVYSYAAAHQSVFNTPQWASLMVRSAPPPAQPAPSPVAVAPPRQRGVRVRMGSMQRLLRGD